MTFHICGILSYKYNLRHLSSTRRSGRWTGSTEECDMMTGRKVIWARFYKESSRSSKRTFLKAACLKGKAPRLLVQNLPLVIVRPLLPENGLPDISSSLCVEWALFQVLYKSTERKPQVFTTGSKWVGKLSAMRTSWSPNSLAYMACNQSCQWFTLIPISDDNWDLLSSQPRPKKCTQHLHLELHLILTTILLLFFMCILGTKDQSL